MTTPDDGSGQGGGNWLLVGLAWALVSIPLLWGIWTTLEKALVMFSR